LDRVWREERGLQPGKSPPKEGGSKKKADRDLADQRWMTQAPEQFAAPAGQPEKEQDLK
jgi:hypothetical protein